MPKGTRNLKKEIDKAARRGIAANRIFELRISIKWCSPPIWRRIQVPDNLTLLELHHIIQTVFSWTNSHFHECRIHNRTYARPWPDSPEPILDESKVSIMEAVHAKRKRLLYTYDFGDNWEHAIVVERMFKPISDTSYPRCIAGKRSGPPDDCGGPGGYDEILRVLADQTHPDYEETKEWVGPQFDPEKFDPDLINHMRHPGTTHPPDRPSIADELDAVDRRHPYLLSRIPVLLERGDPFGREFAMRMREPCSPACGSKRFPFTSSHGT